MEAAINPPIKLLHALIKLLHATVEIIRCNQIMAKKPIGKLQQM